MAKGKMKAWYNNIDAATLQRIKAYSAFDDAKSKNLMMQTMYEYREKEIQDFKETNHELAETCIARKKRIDELEEENAELKRKVGLSIDCEKAQKNGELCLGYSEDEDEPCERCKNCIKCECGYYQLGEIRKDEQLTKAKEIILRLYNAGRDVLMCRAEEKAYDNLSEAISDRSIEQFLDEVEHG